MKKIIYPKSCIKCEESISHSDSYKVSMLEKMLDYELSSNGGYGARLTHKDSGAKPITVDADAIRMLIDYYS